MGKHAMPVSKAKTAYGLLSEIRKLILEEPLRYDQSTFNTDGSFRDDKPACGTVCCVAGWVAVLKTETPRILQSTFEIENFADEVLGLSGTQSCRLFDSDAAGDNSSPALHAKRGAAHIAKFQKKYAAQLKAKKV